MQKWIYIYVTRKGFRSQDYDKHSKSFYQILLKTEAFKGFDQGQIFMDDKATMCDGYGVMQELLRMVLPVYTKKALPKVAPMYEDDIYAYQKAMRHYFHLWKLANHRDTDHHKALHFLRGLAGTEWEDIVQTMFHTIKLNNPDKTHGKVEQKYRLSSITTTVK